MGRAGPAVSNLRDDGREEQLSHEVETVEMRISVPANCFTEGVVHQTKIRRFRQSPAPGNSGPYLGWALWQILGKKDVFACSRTSHR